MMFNDVKIIMMKNEIYKRPVSTEAVARRCSVKKVFLEISQNPQENICARVSFFKSGRFEKILRVVLQPFGLTWN